MIELTTVRRVGAKDWKEERPVTGGYYTTMSYRNPLGVLLVETVWISVIRFETSCAGSVICLAWPGSNMAPIH